MEDMDMDAPQCCPEIGYEKAGTYSEKPYVYNPQMDWDRKQLYMDVIRIGLGQLVAVAEVLHAADAVMQHYDGYYGALPVEPEVPYSLWQDNEFVSDPAP
jgi:hypothetical protein